MAVECPAPGCDFEGLVDQVAGHIGGRSDQLHDGMVPTVVRDGAERVTQEVTEEGIPREILILLAIAAGLAVMTHMARQVEAEVEEEQGVPFDGA